MADHPLVPAVVEGEVAVEELPFEGEGVLEGASAEAVEPLPNCLWLKGSDDECRTSVEGLTEGSVGSVVASMEAFVAEL